MKNSKFLLPLFLISLFGLVSCRNESIDAPSQTQTIESTKKRAFDPKPNPNDDVYVKLRLFNEQLRTFERDASLREVQTMPVDKVVWNVEAYLNAAYGHSDKPFTGQKVLQDSFVVALTNGEVLGSTVVSTLASAKSLVIEQYRKTSESGKHIVLVDIASKLLGSNQVQLMVSSFIGLNPVQIRTNPYTSTDNWKWSGLQGKCNGTEIGRDAITRLNEELNARYLVPATVRNPVHTFVTDASFVETSARNWRVPNDIEDNIRDYLMFNQSDIVNTTNFSTCINFQDMNWYYNNIYSIVSNTAPMGIRPVGKYFTASALKANAIIHGFSNIIFHDATIFFAVHHFCWVSEPCDPLSNCYLECD